MQPGVLQMVINIGEATSFKAPDGWQVEPDDRQSIEKVIGGVVVVDNGIIANGEVITCTAIFTAANYTLINGYWVNRTKVTITDEKGESLTNRRVIVRRISTNSKFPQKYILQLEFWKV